MKHTSIITAILLAHSGLASADETAESAFKRAQTAFKAGRVHEACEAFQASDKLAPSVDTQLALANCFEQDGKPASAARLYRSTVDTDDNAERRRSSTAKAKKLEARAPRLRFAINPIPPGLVIKVDGLEVPSTEDARVDTGPHEVVATAPGFEGHASAPVDRERAIVDVIIRMEAHAQPAPERPPAPIPPATTTTTPAPAPAVSLAPAITQIDPPTSHRKRNAFIIGGAGVGMLAASGVLYAASSSKFDDERALCPRSQCKNTADIAKAQSLISDSRTLGGVSIGVGIGGVALLAVGSYLLLTPHTDERSVAVQLDRSGGSVSYSASF